MSADANLRVVFCWHMHQPNYRGPDASDYQLPWVYLHGIKDSSATVARVQEFLAATPPEFVDQAEGPQ